MLYNSIYECVGNTPMFRLHRMENLCNLKGNLLVKLESMNPTGSAKDRAALYMLRDAFQEGKINQDTVIIEPTSGNTGVALAAFCASLGLRVIFTMPENMSYERQLILKAYGAELVLTPKDGGMAASIEKANELKQSIPNAWIPDQFNNSSNKLAHEETTGPEILRDTNGNVDIFIAGVGTGGTFSGTSAYLKKNIPHIRTIGVEPKNSPFLSEGKKGVHGLMGIGAGFEPGNFDRKFCDEIFTVSEEDAYEAARNLAKTEGILCGISSGAALYCGITFAQKSENTGKTIVVILPDTGERYLSTPLFSL